MFSIGKMGVERRTLRPGWAAMRAPTRRSRDSGAFQFTMLRLTVMIALIDLKGGWEEDARNLYEGRVRLVKMESRVERVESGERNSQVHQKSSQEVKEQ